MIDVKTKIHDKLSVEFKVGFEGSLCQEQSEFAINTWIFLPSSLDVSPATYSKQDFHRDVKSNIRLITPDYALRQLADSQSKPYSNLCDAVEALGTTASETMAEQEYRFQLKLYASIYKSALRDEVEHLKVIEDPSLFEFQTLRFLEDLKQSTDLFRSLRRSIAEPFVAPYSYADEFMSHITEVRMHAILKRSSALGVGGGFQSTLLSSIEREQQYKRRVGYATLSPEPQALSANAALVARHSLLKKHVESALYLKVDTQRDGKAVEQFWFGIAAGMAMIISTLIALPFQHYWAQYPTLIFIILVVAYMFKDRTKEYMRGLFSNQLKNRYFDQRTDIKLKDQNIGWIKESVDFVPDGKLPADVLSLRQRSSIEMDEGQLREQILFYRKRVLVDNTLLRNRWSYDFEGIHDIMRFHLRTITQKMDDPITSVSTLDTKGCLHNIAVPRTYTLYMVMQFLEKGSNTPEYKVFRIVCTRDGIVEIV